ncbi:MAG TPA: hypothetical protein VHG71_00305 [Verrucomicrobiae bacterium]|nr:hypothetical protein [Verrucomicrobiae bacterium]
MKVVDGKTKRSKFYHLLNPTCPINHALKGKSDTIGSVFVVCLVLITVGAVRLALDLVK